MRSRAALRKMEGRCAIRKRSSRAPRGTYAPRRKGMGPKAWMPPRQLAGPSAQSLRLRNSLGLGPKLRQDLMLLDVAVAAQVALNSFLLQVWGLHEGAANVHFEHCHLARLRHLFGPLNDLKILWPSFNRVLGHLRFVFFGCLSETRNERNTPNTNRFIVTVRAEPLQARISLGPNGPK